MIDHVEILSMELTGFDWQFTVAFSTQVARSYPIETLCLRSDAFMTTLNNRENRLRHNAETEQDRHHGRVLVRAQCQHDQTDPDFGTKRATEV